MNQLSPKTTETATVRGTISVALAESLPACGILWWYGRIVDSAGVGRVELDLSVVCADLDRSYKTVRQYVRDCEKLGLIRGLSVEGRRVSFHYISIVNACLLASRRAARPIGIGTTYEISISELKHTKFLNAEACAMHNQQKSHYAMVDERKKRENSKHVKVDSLGDVFKPLQSVSRGQTLIYRTDRYAFMSEEFTLFGANLESNADSLGRTARTAQRRLSNSYRESRGIDSVEKIQIAQKLNSRQNNWKEFSRMAFDSRDSEAGNILGKTFNVGSRVFEAKCNLYNSSITLSSKRHWRQNLKSALPDGNKGQIQAHAKTLHQKP